MNFFTPVLGYYVFYDYIINELCVQKDAEENFCMGKCHLKKQAEENSKPDTNNDQNVQIKTESHSPHFSKILSTSPYFSNSQNCFQNYSTKILNEFTEPLTPPPRLIS